MKWLERRTTDRDDLETRLIERKFGLAGCTIWDRLQLIVAENMEGLNTKDWGYVAEDETMQSLADQIRCTLPEFKEFVAYCDEMMILEKKDGRLFCKYVLDRMNEYARKIVKKEKSEKTDFPKNPRNIHNTTQHNTTQTHLQPTDIATDVAALPSINQLLGLFENINPEYQKFYSNKTERKALSEMIDKYGFEKMENLLRSLPEIIAKKYAPRITTPLQLQKKMGELLIFLKQEQINQPSSKHAFYEEVQT